jgi:hypothetical protein
MKGYDTFDASIGLAKGAWDVLFYGQNLCEQEREHVHDLGPGHPGAGAAASAGARREGRLQVLMRTRQPGPLPAP